MNPFAKHDISDFPGVLVPLEDAHRHSTVTKKYEEKLGSNAEGSSTPDVVDSEKDGAHHSAEYTPYTIEGLRSEVETDLQAGGVSTAYDRT